MTGNMEGYAHAPPYGRAPTQAASPARAHPPPHADNNIGDVGAQALANALSTNASLKQLDLQSMPLPTPSFPTRLTCTCVRREHVSTHSLVRRLLVFVCACACAHVRVFCARAGFISPCACLHGERVSKHPLLHVLLPVFVGNGGGRSCEMCVCVGGVRTSMCVRSVRALV
jgi:hypothetical protein